MPQSFLGEALAAGASIVTPNNRLAREIALQFDAARMAAGERAWVPAQALPWGMWVERVWLIASAAAATPRVALLEEGAARELWHRIVADNAPGLLNIRGAARHAAQAWSLFHAWRDPGESLAHIVASGDDDARSFAEWGGTYAQRLTALAAVDQAQLPHVLAQSVSTTWTAGLGRVVLYGFLALTPQQRRLITTLRNAGVVIDELAIDDRPARSRHQVACATPSLELEQALAFARSRVVADPRARVAIVVADLDARRSETIALAEEILCPERLLALAPDASRPYDISLGEPLGGVPIVASALDLIALSAGELDATAAAAVIRSPFLPDANSRWHARGAIERRWRQEGRRAVTWNDVAAALRRHDGDLHARFATLPPMPRGEQLPRDWARLWSDWLRALGWPGTAALASEQWQAHEAWSSALARFAATGMITGEVPARTALASLRALLADTSWAPEGGLAQIRILGVLEAAGLRFDCAWLAGFDAQRWPPAPAANPFLPLAWQRLRRVTGAHPDTALVRAQQLTEQLEAIADEVIVSHAEHIDDAPSAMSPLFASWPQLPDAARPTRDPRWSESMPAVELERRRDDRAPPLSERGELPGNAGLFESQSACPFQAFARYRLRSDAWDECPEGLSAKERGTVLHAVLTAFWDDVRDHATLVALDGADLAARIARAVDAGKSKLPAARWQALPPAIASAETRRLAVTLHAWVGDGEKTRPAFRVQGHEQPIAFELEGIAVRARIDRIDELDAGGLVVVDYKSGFVVRPARWFAPRPEGAQLAVYAHGLDAASVGPIRALVFAQVKAGEIEVSGLAEAGGLWPGLDVPQAGRGQLPATFDEARARLDAGLVALAREIRDGIADVTPRDRAACQYCEQKPLCRIRTLDDPLDAAERAGVVDE
jgi:ATP-dependent helicase/nuclease subunit B